MRIEFDLAKDAANPREHGVLLAFGARVFEDERHIVVPARRPEDGEGRWKAVGLVGGALYTAVHVWRGEVIRFISVLRSNAGEERLYHSAFGRSNDPEDFDVSVAGLERGLLGRALRQLRGRLGLSVADFAARYGIPASEYGGYESVRVAPPAAVIAYLRVIVAEPEATARAVQQAA